MLLERFSTPGLEQVARIAADPQRGVAMVNDPRPDIDEYLTWTLDHGVAFVAILETHLHANFVSGARNLDATGAPTYAGRLRESAFPHEPIDELATSIDIACNQLRVLDVRDPDERNVAHLPGSHVVLADDIARGELPDFLRQDDEPVAVIRGTGYRSRLAASLFGGRGKRGVSIVPGGVTAWLEAGLPTN